MCKHIEEPRQVNCTSTQPIFDDLKAAAEKLGYTLVKKKAYVPLKPCPVCGKKRTTVWCLMADTRCEFRKCESCGFRGDTVTKSSDLNQAWNDAVDRYLKESRK